MAKLPNEEGESILRTDRPRSQMLTQEIQHPDMFDWEVDEDLRRARIISRSRMRNSSMEWQSTSSSLVSSATSNEYDQNESLLVPESIPVATKSENTARAEKESEAEYPPSPQGGWRPLIFATAGFVGGNIAMTLGGVSPKYLPTIIIAEAVLGVLICIAFYPRRHRTAQLQRSQKRPA